MADQPHGLIPWDVSVSGAAVLAAGGLLSSRLASAWWDLLVFVAPLVLVTKLRGWAGLRTGRQRAIAREWRFGEPWSMLIASAVLAYPASFIATRAIWGGDALDHPATQLGIFFAISLVIRDVARSRSWARPT